MNGFRKGRKKEEQGPRRAIGGAHPRARKGGALSSSWVALHQRVRPPSRTKVWPVMNSARMMNRTASVMSWGSPVLASGARLIKSDCHSGGSPGMVIVPGAMALTRTLGASSLARTRVRRMTPALEMEWGRNSRQPMRPPVSAKLTMTPFPDCVRYGAADWQQKNEALRLVSREASQVASEVWPNLVSRKLAALLIRMSRRWNSLATRAMR